MKQSILRTSLLLITLLSTSVCFAQELSTDPQPLAEQEVSLSEPQTGLQIPQLSTEERLGLQDPMIGMIVFDTDLSAFCYRTENAWEMMISQDPESLNGIPSHWPDALDISDKDLAAKGGSQGTMKFMGDDGDWIISGDDMYNSNSGHVGIGTSTPGYNFEVHGSDGHGMRIYNNTKLGNNTFNLFLTAESDVSQNSIVNFLQGESQLNGQTSRGLNNVCSINNSVNTPGSSFFFGVSTATVSAAKVYEVQGIKNEFLGDHVLTVGVNNEMNSPSNEYEVGIQNFIGGSDAPTFEGLGMLNRFEPISAGSVGDMVGTENDFTALSNSSAAVNKYGTKTVIPEANGGIHYGIFSHVPGSQNYAGRFFGRVKIGGTPGGSGANGYVLPTSEGVAGQVLTAGPNGATTWEDGSSVINATNGLSVTNNEVRMGGTITSSTNIIQNSDHLTHSLNGNGDFIIRHGNNAILTADGSNNDLIVNESGAADADFRVESDNLTNMLFVDASANRIGINNNTPNGYLHISANSSGSVPQLELTEINNSSDGARLNFTNASQTNNMWTLYGRVSNTSSSSQFNFYHPGVGDILRLRGNGKVGIMTTPSYALHMPQHAANGYARAVVWTTYSDARIKEDVKDLEYGLSTVMDLKPKAYVQIASEFEEGKLKLDRSVTMNQIGFIAQELHKVIPEAVTAPENEQEELWGVDYTRLIPVLTKAMQEQQQMLEAQQRQIEEQAELIKELMKR